jgi:hypothetical protein
MEIVAVSLVDTVDSFTLMDTIWPYLTVGMMVGTRWLVDCADG